MDNFTNIDIIHFETTERNAQAAQLWAVYYGLRVLSVSFTSAPHWQSETIDFAIPRQGA